MTEALKAAIATIQRQSAGRRASLPPDEPARMPPAIRYLFAIAAVALAAAAGWLIERYVGATPPYLTFYPAVLVVALVVGGGPGAVATVLSALAVDHAPRSSGGSSGMHGAADWIALVVFTATSAALCILAERIRRSKWNQLVAIRQVQLLRVTMASIKEGVIATDVEGRVLFLNDTAEALTGTKLAEAAGRPLESIFSLFDCTARCPVTGLVERVLRTGSCEIEGGELELRSRRGDTLPVEFEAAALRANDSDDAGVFGAVITFRDCTERQLAQREVRRILDLAQAEKEWLSQVLNSINEEVYFTDTQKRYRFVNPAAVREFGPVSIEGAEVEQVIGNLSVYRPDGSLRPVEEAPPLRALKGEIIRDEEQIVRSPRSGELRHRQVSAAPVRDAGGAIVGSVSVARDITDRKRQENALREADHRKNVFLATLAHELRNPLAPIRTAARLLESPGISAADLQRCRAIISRQVTQMASLLDDLLDVSRLTRGELTLKKAYVPLQRVLEEAVEAAQPLINAKNHQLRLESQLSGLSLEVDPVRLAQIIGNLLTNAAKYTDPGGQITLGAHLEEGALVISVRDNGIGLEAEALQRIFEMFVQVAPSKDRTEGGLGIGLALVKALVELHGGTIAASSPGRERGSTFTVRLPHSVVAEEPSGQPAPAGGAARSAAARSVLIADDNVDGVEVLAMLLQTAGHEVHTAADGAAALELAAKLRPDVAVLDIGMPGLNGYELAKRIRREAWGTRMTLIAVTGWGQERDKREAVAAGFDHHLTKPVDPDVLERLIGSRGGFNAEVVRQSPASYSPP